MSSKAERVQEVFSQAVVVIRDYATDSNEAIHLYGGRSDYICSFLREQRREGWERAWHCIEGKDAEFSFVCRAGEYSIIYVRGDLLDRTLGRGESNE